MTVCEIVTHRIFVGLHHSRQLLRRPALWQHWLEVLDGLGGFVDLVPGRGPGMQQSDPGEADSVRIWQGPTSVDCQWGPYLNLDCVNGLTGPHDVLGH